MPTATKATLAEFVTMHRNSGSPTADIEKRYRERIQSTGIDLEGSAGAGTYLARFGKNIKSKKVIALANASEYHDRPRLAEGFWRKAYEMETRLIADNQSVAPVPSPQPEQPAALLAGDLPRDLQPGAISPMLAVDSEADRESLIQNSSYVAQPKRDGCRALIVASAEGIWVQARSLQVSPLGEATMRDAIAAAVAQHGPFVLDGELCFLDGEGREHRTGAQAQTANSLLGKANEAPMVVYSIFTALYVAPMDLRGLSLPSRIAFAEEIVGSIQSFCDPSDRRTTIELLPTARTPEEKAALCELQRSEGREGEIWIDAGADYLVGKSHRVMMVRTKYFDDLVVTVTELTPSKDPKRPFGALKVSETSGQTGELVPVGSVGSGFSASDYNLIVTGFQKAREAGVPFEIEVRTQGRTETGKLWHARFLRVPR